MAIAIGIVIQNLLREQTLLFYNYLAYFLNGLRRSDFIEWAIDIV